MDYNHIAINYNTHAIDYKTITMNYNPIVMDYNGIEMNNFHIVIDYNHTAMDYNGIVMDYNGIEKDYKPIVMNCEATIMENAQKALNGDKKYRYQTQIKPSFSATRNETLRVTYFVCLRQSVCGTHVFPVPANFEDYHIYR